VAGVLAALHRLGRVQDRERALQLSLRVEGHPDNVASALLGGLCISLARGLGQADSHYLCRRLPLSPAVAATLVIPEVRLETEAARAVVPQQIPIAMAARTAARVGLLVSELAAEEPDAQRLGLALSDELHEPARESLVPALSALQAQAVELGAWGGVLSGAGPSVLFLHSQSVTLDPGPLLAAWSQVGVEARILSLKPAVEGARIVTLEPGSASLASRNPE
jgi:homoserine kinase